MASTITATQGTGETAGTTQLGAADKIQADKNLFLKLLITQLQNQDPMNPMEDKEFIAQLAQFTTVEKLSSIDSALSSSTTAAQSQQAVSLIGKTVSVLDPSGDGEPAVGVVDSVALAGKDGPVLRIGKQEFPMSWVVEVR
ncbi:MAG: hypothetical protein IT209_06910 [Armatimonadetes bacterium]|nr:hypothetical protein [Armatimonadota bacterium]